MRRGFGSGGRGFGAGVPTSDLGDPTRKRAWIVVATRVNLV